MHFPQVPGSSPGRGATTHAPAREPPRLAVVQQELQDDAGRDGDEDVVGAVLNPLVPARRHSQVVAAPVIPLKGTY